MLYVAVALGGAVGAVLRYLLIHWNVASFPFGTLTVNLLGSFVLGVFLTVTERKWRLPSAWRTGIATGMIGTFTTFSAFSLEIVQLVTQGELMAWVLAWAYMGISVLGGVLLAWGGMVLVGRGN